MYKVNVFSTVLSGNFLKIFIENLYSGQILADFDQFQDFALHDLEIYIPTKRAARALKQEFISYKADISFLPKIIPFAELKQELDFQNMLNMAENAYDYSEAVSSNERLIVLSEIVYRWQESLLKNLDSKAQEHIFLQNHANSIMQAQDLAALFDQAALNDVDWSKLDKISENLELNLSEWWQITANFFKEAVKSWNLYLNSLNKIDIGVAQKQAFFNLANFIKKDNKPRIILGATGAVTAVAKLMQAFASVKNTAIILPGLDRDLPEDIWRLFEEQNDATLYSQAQYSYYHLLKQLKIKREDVKFLGQDDAALRLREKYIAYALAPSPATKYWRDLPKDKLPQAFANVALIEANDEREEALAIAVALRLAVEDGTKKAALVTSNRMLAQRVQAELRRFGIEANDSAQRNFLALDLGKWLNLILSNVNDSNIESFLALLRHPFTRLGFEKAELNNIISLYELYRLRGAYLRFSILDIKQQNQEIYQQWLNREYESKTSNSKNDEAIELLVEQIAQAIEPLRVLYAKPKTNLKEALQALICTMELFAKDENGAIDKIYQEEGAEELIAFCEDLVNNELDFSFDVTEFEQIFAAIFSNLSLEAPYSHSNIHIWGIIESRLQNVDMVVIAGLNEGQLPPLAQSSALLARNFMLALKMPPPESTIGALALELQQLLASSEVLLTRSKIVDNVAQISSRWLQRIETLIGPEIANQVKARGQKYLDYAHILDGELDIDINFIAQRVKHLKPICKPPLALRPKDFAITEIEKLSNNAYAIYADKILKLKPLKELVQIPNYAQKGILYHEILAHFLQNKEEKKDYGESSRLFQKNIMDIFAEYELPKDVKRLWLADINNIMPHFLEFELKREVISSFCELKSKKVAIGKQGCFIYGRADRIDICPRNSDDNELHLEIIDYKTGVAPTINSVKNFDSPQLLLEAAILQKNGFILPESNKIKILGLYYLQLKSDGIKVNNIDEPEELQELIDNCWAHVGNLIDSYFDIHKAYSMDDWKFNLRDAQYCPYYHLSRHEEWSR